MVPRPEKARSLVDEPFFIGAVMTDQTPGQPRRGRKPTRDEMRVRITAAVEMLAVKGWKKFQIKAAFKKQWGCGPRTVERYLTKARAILRAEAGKSDEDHLSESYAFYKSVLANDKATLREKTKAQENLDKLLGLRKPFKVAQTDAAGNDIPDDELAERKRRVIAALERIKSREAMKSSTILDQMDPVDN